MTQQGCAGNLGAPSVSETESVAEPDERLQKGSLLTAALHRPELGAVAGTVLVAAFFMIYASNYNSAMSKDFKCKESYKNNKR